MTCIVGLVDKDGVVLGGDSAGVDESFAIESRTDPKVFTRGPFVIGFAGSFRIGQLLRYKLTTPQHQIKLEDHEYMATRFVDAVRKCLKDNGAVSDDFKAETGGTFLVVYRNKLYSIQEDYQVACVQDSFDAIGCGSDIAKGALYVLPKDMTTEDRALKALQAAERFSAGVRGPFHLVRSKKQRKKVK
jgi:ATP-dependent protease HslVU (ClpYQ) peptidase subunit